MSRTQPLSKFSTNLVYWLERRSVNIGGSKTHSEIINSHRQNVNLNERMIQDHLSLTILTDYTRNNSGRIPQ